MKFASGIQSPTLFKLETNYKFSPSNNSSKYHKGLNSKFLKKIDNGGTAKPELRDKMGTA
jgi:hypothetical protein